MNRDASLKQNRLLISALFSILLVSFSFAQDSLTITRTFNHTYPSQTWGVSLFDNYLYVGGGVGLQTWNIASLTNPTLVNSLTPLSSEVIDIGNHYAVDLGGSVCHVLNTVDPAHPSIVHSFTLPYVDQVVAVDSIVYIADRYVGIHVYSFANPVSPRLITNISNSGMSSVAVEGNRLFAGQTSGGLSVFDITNRTSPILIGSIAGTSTARRLVVRDGIVYVANYDAGVKVYNATNPASIQLLNQWHDFSSGSTHDVLLAGNRLYVANGTNGLWIFDVSNSEHFVQIGRLATCSFVSLRLQSNTLFAAEYSTGFSIYRIDSTNPPPPPPQDSLMFTRVFNHVYPNAITWESSLRGNFLDVHYFQGGLQTWDVTSPENPVITNTLQPYGGEVIDLGNNYAFMAGAGSGTEIGHCAVLNTTNPSRPTIVTSFTVAFAHTILAVDSIIFIADYYNGMHIYSLAHPTTPRWVGDIQNNGFGSLAHEGNRLYAGLTEGGVIVYDISNPVSPIQIGAIAATSISAHMQVRDGILYVANESAGLTIYDATNLRNVRLLNRWNAHNSGNVSTCYALLDESRLYVANGWSGLWALDVSDPTHPIEIGHFANCVPLHLRLRGNYLYSSEYRDGFSIYRIDTNTPPPPQAAFNITHPNGGERLTINALDTIRWTTNDNFNAVMIKINYNYPNGDWVTIDGSSPNDGQEVWMVTGPVTDHARIKICAVSDPDTMDISESDFVITTSGLMDAPDELPFSSRLVKAYPNPFNNATTITFTLPQSENTRVDIFNLRGQLIESLYSGRMAAGEHSVKWVSNQAASGTYVYRLQVGKQVLTERVTLIK